MTPQDSPGYTEGGAYHFTTLAGDQIAVTLNLSQEQWEAYVATPEKPTPHELWAFFDTLGVSGLGLLDIKRLSSEWGPALSEALGLTPGESDGSTEPSTESTAGPSPSTSAGSRASRSKK